MGKLTYAQLDIHFDDYTLAHLLVIVTAKLRRHESFQLSWRDADETGNGRTAIWLHPAIPLIYRFDSDSHPAMNEAWLATLMAGANSPQGLHLSPEPTGHVTAHPTHSNWAH
jgi:hypothetical protein